MSEFEVFVRSVYNYDRNAAGDESGLRCEDATRTKQSFAVEADINEIVRRFGLSGELPDNGYAPRYGDFTGITDFHAALSAIALARESFETLPADVRRQFQNDPGRFVDFCSDSKNLSQLRAWGLTRVKEGSIIDVGVNGVAVVKESGDGGSQGGSQGVPAGVVG
jgi:phage internal scaffolding protein